MLKKYLDSHIEHHTENIADTWQCVALHLSDLFCILENARHNAISIIEHTETGKKYTVYKMSDNSVIVAHYVQVGENDFSLSEIGIGNGTRYSFIFVQRAQAARPNTNEKVLSLQSMAQWEHMKGL